MASTRSCRFPFLLSRTSFFLFLVYRSLYDTCHWDERAIRKLIGDGKAAARFKGLEIRTPECNHECPICFLYYSEINVTRCCHANICTECFLQVRPQREKQSTCPFCNHSKLNIDIAKQLTEQEIRERQKEEEEAEQARIRARQQHSSPVKISDKADSFGSSLERDSRVAMCRARSESFASSEHSQEPMADTSMIQSMAMTPEDRSRLEAEMRSQNMHPLALQIEAEAQQRRARNERNYNRSHSDQRGYRTSDIYGRSRRRNRPQGSRDWNQIVEAFEESGNGAVHSLDDLVVLEAAILLSREEESRSRRNGDDEEFDAARHARDGFPLVRSFLASRGRNDEPDLQLQVQNLARTLNSSRRRNQLLRSSVGSHLARAMPETAFDTAALLMRGVSEEEQLAMAIAASLQDQTSTTNSNSNTGSSNEEETDNEAIPCISVDDVVHSEEDEDTLSDDETEDIGSQVLPPLQGGGVAEREEVSGVPVDETDTVSDASCVVANETPDLCLAIDVREINELPADEEELLTDVDATQSQSMDSIPYTTPHATHDDDPIESSTSVAQETNEARATTPPPVVE